jgi:diadenosine tetraphosphate (Ap4A) HIT family hydrolase
LLLGVLGDKPATQNSHTTAAAAAAAPSRPPAVSGPGTATTPAAAAAAAASGDGSLVSGVTSSHHTDYAEHQLVQQQHVRQLASKDTLIAESTHCRAWLDAKARPMIVVTPKQHVEELIAMTDAQLVDLVRTAMSVLKQLGCSSFTSMILNQGDSRNHAHLHLKVRVHERDFDRAAAGWPDKVRHQLEALKHFRDVCLPPEKRGTHAAYMLKRRQQQQQHIKQSSRHGSTDIHHR